MNVLHSVFSASYKTDGVACSACFSVTRFVEIVLCGCVFYIYFLNMYFEILKKNLDYYGKKKSKTANISVIKCANLEAEGCSEKYLLKTDEYKCLP